MISAERETIIRWDDEEKMVHIWTASPSVGKRCQRMGFVMVNESHDKEGKLRGQEFVVPLSEFRWRRKRKGQPRATPISLAKRPL